MAVRCTAVFLAAFKRVFLTFSAIPAGAGEFLSVASPGVRFITEVADLEALIVFFLKTFR